METPISGPLRSSPPSKRFARRGLPLLAGLAVFGFSVYVSSLVVGHEDSRTKEKVLLAAAQLANQISTQLEFRIFALEEMAKDLSGPASPQPDEWARELARYADHFDDDLALAWVGGDYRLRWVVPRRENEGLPGWDLGADPRVARALAVAAREHGGRRTPALDLPSGERGFLVVLPLSSGTGSQGFLAGVYRIRRLMDDVLKLGRTPGYGLAVFDRDTEIYASCTNGRRAEETWGREAPIRFQEVPWRIRVWPEKVPQAEARGLLPGSVVLLGFLISFLPALIAYSLGLRGRRRAERAFRESEERYALAAEGANDGLWDWDLASDEIYFSPRWRAILGYEEEEFGHRPGDWFTRVHPEDIAGLKERISLHLGGQTSHFESEHRMRHRDGGYRWMLCRGLAVRRPGGRAYRMAGSLRDIDQQKTVEAGLVHDALHDPLTGLPNRAYFLDILRRRIAHTQRRKDYRFAVLFVDLDRFKEVNDRLGHEIGDQLLIAVARLLQSILRPEDALARHSGDEFTILFDDIEDFADSARIAQRILDQLESPFRLGGFEVVMGASIGIALSSTGYEQPESMLRDADEAMYRAKSRGRSRLVVFEPEMHAKAAERLRLETDLRQALERSEFRLRYQPIVDLRTNRIEGFEALLHWERPGRGLVPPGEFLPVMEQMGLVDAVGRWALREVCRQLRAWRQHEMAPDVRGLAVSINLPEKQSSHPDLVEHVAGALDEHGVEPTRLRLEFTERVILEDAESAARVLEKLRRLGIRLYLDDFGTGYSSVSHLHRFPIDSVKVDRQLLTRAIEEEQEDRLLRGIVALAQRLGKEVIAEGVETEEHCARLRELGCHLGQGLHFSPPVDPDAALAMVQARSPRARELQ